MYYINKTPTENGSYGNPQSNEREDTYALPDELLSAYIKTMGFAKLTVGDDGVVTAVKVNKKAYDAYQAEHPEPVITPADQRENAYNNEEIIEWDGKMITVTAAATLWEYYAAEGSDKATTLQELIAAAKADIRERYPDEYVF